jgi:hypothetical protein
MPLHKVGMFRVDKQLCDGDIIILLIIKCIILLDINIP